MANEIQSISNSVRYVVLIAFLSAIGLMSIVSVILFRPDQDNTALIATIIGFLTPICGTILAIMVKDIHTDINSRMTELLNLTRSSAKAEGKLEGPDVNRTV